jgi:hypothetical protein
MFKPFIFPLVNAWNKLLKGYMLPSNLRHILLILFAVGIIQLVMFGSVVVAVIAIMMALP